VAKGFSQRPGVDYTEVFAPTFRMASIRTIIALSALNDYHLHSIDISSAFSMVIWRRKFTWYSHLVLSNMVPTMSASF